MTSILFLLEDDLNFISNGRRPPFQMEDDLNFFSIGRRHKLSFYIEVNLYILLLQKRRQHKIFKIEDDINFLQFSKIFQLVGMS